VSNGSITTYNLVVITLLGLLCTTSAAACIHSYLRLCKLARDIERYAETTYRYVDVDPSTTLLHGSWPSPVNIYKSSKFKGMDSNGAIAQSSSVRGPSGKFTNNHRRD
jgi:hypothetical protein